jgi:hypothetical protein
MYDDCGINTDTCQADKDEILAFSWPKEGEVIENASHAM